MNCSLRRCSGDYQKLKVNQSFERDGHHVDVDGIPALVCEVCGDVIFSAETAKAVEVILNSKALPNEHIPLYKFG